MMRPTRRRIIPRPAARETECGSEIDGEDLIPFLVPESHENIVPRDAGVVDQNIELTHCGFRSRNEVFHIFLVGEIAAHHMHATAQSTGERIEHFVPCSGNRDGRTIGVERVRNGAADAAGCPGDESGPAGKIKHGGILQTVSAALNARMSSGAPIGVAVAPSAMRLTRPLSTLPEPTS